MAARTVRTTFERRVIDFGGVPLCPSAGRRGRRRVTRSMRRRRRGGRGAGRGRRHAAERGEGYMPAEGRRRSCLARWKEEASRRGTFTSRQVHAHAAAEWNAGATWNLYRNFLLSAACREVISVPPHSHSRFHIFCSCSNSSMRDTLLIAAPASRYEKSPSRPDGKRGMLRPLPPSVSR